MIKLPVLVLITMILLAGCTNKDNGNFQSQPTEAANQPTKTPTQSPNPPPSSTDSNSIVYSNKQYGFQFSLPESWKGYSIVDRHWEGNVMDKNIREKSMETGPILSIRDPRWTAQTPRQDIPIMVFTIRQWDSLLREEFFIGAAALKPSELGHNDKYVFAIPARYNFAYPPGYEDVDKILQSGPLSAFN
ncbi:hypothetical protein RJP21_11985 [Paenibacillus sp. VCA1]|uniref:hypothetical protein n=1 Tax=Paenibacillus sp. VCA1 TaxID=3039148 RepID=UPI00287205AA|nr:hypothetical protein [Paenibacillus sp. VCA1]MDR9854323.1 hypothetical protein [Paenibacillus sp. VCA1]